jgi:hypothetical protein
MTIVRGPAGPVVVAARQRAGGDRPVSGPIEEVGGGDGPRESVRAGQGWSGLVAAKTRCATIEP